MEGTASCVSRTVCGGSGFEAVVDSDDVELVVEADDSDPGLAVSCDDGVVGGVVSLCI
jgi:hypothetical protein